MDDNIGIIDLLRQFATRHDPDRLDDVLELFARVVAALAESLSDEDAEI